METSELPKQFLVKVCVLLRKPLFAEDVRIVGYYRNFAVTACSSKVAWRLVKSTICDGVLDERDSTIKEIDLSNLHEDIAIHCPNATELGIWYTSGRALFPED